MTAGVSVPTMLHPRLTARLRLSFAAGRAVVACHAPRAAGAAAALALAERVAALFRDLGPAGFGSPAVELDGRDPDGFRAVVTVPIGR